MSKVFVIGLPRTGTTSVCCVLLDAGLKVAHTAYTKHTFDLADAVADTPCYCDYKLLDRTFPSSRFVYLDRSIELWVPSMQMLLQKVTRFNTEKPGKLNPILIRCFDEIFGINSASNLMEADYLRQCYLMHKEEVFSYFSGRSDFLGIDISDEGSLGRLYEFLKINNGLPAFPVLNRGKMINHWDEINNENKIGSNCSGEQGRKYFQV